MHSMSSRSRRKVDEDENGLSITLIRALSLSRSREGSSGAVGGHRLRCLSHISTCHAKVWNHHCRAAIADYLSDSTATSTDSAYFTEAFTEAGKAGQTKHKHSIARVESCMQCKTRFRRQHINRVCSLLIYKRDYSPGNDLCGINNGGIIDGDSATCKR